MAEGLEVFGLSRPATLLIEKVSNAIGRHFDPSQTLRMAEAEAKAQHIRRVAEAHTDVEVAGLLQRAANRLAHEEVAKQRNIESIVTLALPHLNDDADPVTMEDDWVTTFFQRCSTVSDEQMHQLWARILAGEANRQGSFSRATVNLVANLESSDVQVFQNLCDFAWDAIGGSGYRVLVFDLTDEIYTDHGMNYYYANQLEDLGLINYSGFGYLLTVPPIGSVHAIYHGRELVVPFRRGEQISAGKIVLTRAGDQLLSGLYYHERKPVEGLFEYVKHIWENDPFRGLPLSQPPMR